MDILRDGMKVWAGVAHRGPGSRQAFGNFHTCNSSLLEWEHVPHQRFGKSRQGVADRLNSNLERGDDQAFVIQDNAVLSACVRDYEVREQEREGAPEVIDGETYLVCHGGLLVPMAARVKGDFSDMVALSYVKKEQYR